MPECVELRKDAFHCLTVLPVLVKGHALLCNSPVTFLLILLCSGVQVLPSTLHLKVRVCDPITQRSCSFLPVYAPDYVQQLHFVTFS